MTIRQTVCSSALVLLLDRVAREKSDFEYARGVEILWDSSRRFPISSGRDVLCRSFGRIDDFEKTVGGTNA